MVLLILGLLAALCLAGRVLAQEQPGPDLEVLCTPMKKKACRLEDLCVWQGRRGGCEAATNICPAIQARKNGQSKRMRCQNPTNSIGIQEVCQCRRQEGSAGLANQQVQIIQGQEVPKNVRSRKFFVVSESKHCAVYASPVMVSAP